MDGESKDTVPSSVTVPSKKIMYNINAKRQPDYPTSVTFLDNGIVCGTRTGYLQKWEAVTHQFKKSLEAHTKTVMQVRSHTNDVVSVSTDGYLMKYDSALEYITVEPKIGRLTCVAYDQTGRYVVVGSENGSIYIYRASDMSLFTDVYIGVGVDIYCLACHTRGPMLRIAFGTTTDMHIREVNMVYPRIRSILRHDGMTFSVAFSPDGLYIAFGCWDGTLRIYDPFGRLQTVIQAHGSPVSSVAYSPDKKRIASGSYDTTIKIWQVSIGQPYNMRLIKTLRGHQDQVVSVAYSPDGTRIVSCSPDKTIRVWGVFRLDKIPILHELENMRTKAHQDVKTDTLANDDQYIKNKGSSPKNKKLLDDIIEKSKQIGFPLRGTIDGIDIDQLKQYWDLLYNQYESNIRPVQHSNQVQLRL